MNYETSTAWWIEKSFVDTNTKLNLKSKLSVLDFQTKMEVPTAYFEIGDYICVPKMKLQALENIIRKKFTYEKIETREHKAIFYKKLILPPMNHQIGVIKDTIEHLTTNADKRVCICARPGFGKTYMSAAIVQRMKCKFIFIVYSSKLVQQTYDAFVKYFGSSDGFVKLDASKGFMEMDWKKVNGLFLTHSMLQSLLKRFGMHNVINVLLNKFKCDLKIMDEYDTYVRNLYFMECWGNFKYNIYLTGTKFKNMRPDDNIFQMIYRHAKTLGDNIKLPVNRNCIIINYKFSPTKREYFLMHMRDETLFKTRYNDFIARKDILLDYIMKHFYKPSEGLIRRVIEEGDTVAIYTGRIENCEIVKKKLIDHYDIKEKDIGIYNSNINKKDKVVSENKPWIITTTQSLGRGYDNNKLRCLIFLEFNFGTANYIQNISRVARIGGKEGYVFEGLDNSFPKVMANHYKKKKEDIYDDMYKNVWYYTIPENIYQYYFYGYRPNEEFAMEIKNKMKRR